MRNHHLICLLFMSCVMILVAGCTDIDTSSLVTPTISPQMNTSATLTVTPEQTSADAASGTAVTPAPTLSVACNDLVSASGADQAFLDYVDDTRLVTRINDLATGSCNKSQSNSLYQVATTSTVPQTTGLVMGRLYLISATTYCQDPDPAAPDNTLTDLAKFTDGRAQYRDFLYACHIEISANASAVAGGEKLDLKNLYGPQTFSGTGNSVKKFSATQGNYKFTVTYSGFGNYSVYITNIYGKTLAEPFHDVIGPYSGSSATVTLPANGEYYMSIEASAPYLLKMEQV